MRLPEASGGNSTLLGYCYEEKVADDEGVVVRVFDLEYRPIGFVTPRGRALRFVKPGASAEANDVGTGVRETAIALIFDVSRPV
ncbi:MAG: hypothetical protein JXP34_17085, partial [Planctomycetes bacterium]|nr:hypothetical protein [Planctomycetota bacterium]